MATLTLSQEKALASIKDDLLGDTKVISINDTLYGERIRVGIKSENGFCYSLYIGKRGKVYETEDSAY